MTEVVWKPIKGYEDRYLVSNRGEIASIFPRPVASRLNRLENLERAIADAGSF